MQAQRVAVALAEMEEHFPGQRPRRQPVRQCKPRFVAKPRGTVHQEQQKKWADHGYELTQQYTIKAAQNNMRSLKAQNAGIVNGMHAKRQDHETIVEAQRQQGQVLFANVHASKHYAMIINNTAILEYSNIKE